ncbi:regulatory protein RecX [Marilutibacter spongiae]|uniref:Regulatory protein RecX n=1 Tax=Marilutibacter spongiae TaxID=2025720 RepID=A0A7W3TN85_9GAMM|nr:regulatory protein RecX [Lysobacter spongiae]MBB1061448.1 regulatory protein RecX [Lysobacter spongiae]
MSSAPGPEDGLFPPAGDPPVADGDCGVGFEGQGGEGRGRRRGRPEQTPLQRALALLSRREHSRKELTAKLVSRGLEPAAVDAAVERLAGEGWQDDARFAEGLVRTRSDSGYGPVRIRAELATHGLDEVAVETAMATFEGDWVELARDLARRRLGHRGLEPGLQAQRKIADLLMRRGFPGDVVRAVSRLPLDEVD